MRHLSLCLIILVSCRSLSSSDLRITNPVDASDRYPEVVRVDIVYANGTADFCSGTFITKSKILTAAHCFFDDEGRPVTEISYMDSNGVVHVGEMSASADYNGNFKNDFLEKDIGLISFSGDLAPAVAKPLTYSTVGIMQKIRLVGYGETNVITHSRLGSKNMGETFVHSLEDNLAHIYGYASNAPKGIEAGIFSGSGPGDSGGAVFNQRGELIGIMVWGDVHNKDPLDSFAKESIFVNFSHPKSIYIIKDISARNCRGEYLHPTPSCRGQICGIQ